MNNGFRIVCIGTYCLPRVIATFNNFKARKRSGEKSCPFDLGFFWDFDEILNSINTEFENFFDDVEYNYFNNYTVKNELNKIFNASLNVKVWKSEKKLFIFNHENYSSYKMFKSRYEERIKNFYDYIQDKSREIYFLIASFKPITNTQIQNLNQIISRYRPEGRFYNIIINQSPNKLDISASNTFVIDASAYNVIFKGGWAEMLEYHNQYKEADELYNTITKAFMKIILRL